MINNLKEREQLIELAVDTVMEGIAAHNLKFEKSLTEICKNERIAKYRKDFEDNIGKVSSFSIKGNKITFYADSWRSNKKKSNTYTFCK